MRPSVRIALLSAGLLAVVAPWAHAEHPVGAPHRDEPEGSAPPAQDATSNENRPVVTPRARKPVVVPSADAPATTPLPSRKQRWHSLLPGMLG